MFFKRANWFEIDLARIRRDAIRISVNKFAAFVFTCLVVGNSFSAYAKDIAWIASSNSPAKWANIYMQQIENNARVYACSLKDSTSGAIFFKSDGLDADRGKFLYAKLQTRGVRQLRVGFVSEKYPTCLSFIWAGEHSLSEDCIAGLDSFVGNYWQWTGSEFLENLGLINSFMGHVNEANSAIPIGTEQKTILQKGALEKHSKRVYVTQSWDDAVLNDVRLVALLKKFNAKATFFVDPGNLSDEEQPADGQPKPGYPYWGWFGYGKLSISEIKELYAGFEVGSHTMTHPPINDLPVDLMRSEIVESKRILELWFGKPVKGFAYPGGGTCTTRVRQELKTAGYIYARTISCDPNDFPPRDPYNLHVSLQWNAHNFWEVFEQIKKQGGVFYFWGHSFEFKSENDWREFESKLARLSADPSVTWITNSEIFEKRQSLR